MLLLIGGGGLLATLVLVGIILLASHRPDDSEIQDLSFDKQFTSQPAPTPNTTPGISRPVGVSNSLSGPSSPPPTRPATTQPRVPQPSASHQTTQLTPSSDPIRIDSTKFGKTKDDEGKTVYVGEIDISNMTNKALYGFWVQISTDGMVRNLETEGPDQLPPSERSGLWVRSDEVWPMTGDRQLLVNALTGNPPQPVSVSVNFVLPKAKKP